MSSGAHLQHQVPHDATVRGGPGEQLQRGPGSGGAGRVSQRHRSHEAEPPLQLQVQERHEEGEELPPHLLEHISEFARYVPTLRTGAERRNSVKENKAVALQVFFHSNYCAGSVK